ncbi:LPXTG-motif protein cell wall anchor domain protein, partial [Tissierellia bacterium KA00581]
SKEEIEKVLEKAKEKIENINAPKGKKEKLPKTSISTIGVSLTALSLLGSIVSKKKKR